MGRRIVIALAVAALVFVALPGCGGNGSGGEEEETATAYQFHPDTPKLFLGQQKCPVCDGEPIKEEFYSDVDGQRLYFDKKECKEKFDSNQSEYMQKFQQDMQKQMGGGG